MEYVRGRSVRELLNASGRLAPAQAADVVAPDARRPRARPREGHRAPRPQAREHPAHDRRRGEAHRPGPRPGLRRRDVDPCRRGHRHRPVPVARADPRRARRSSVATCTRWASSPSSCSPASCRSPARRRCRSPTSTCPTAVPGAQRRSPTACHRTWTRFVAARRRQGPRDASGVGGGDGGGPPGDPRGVAPREVAGGGGRGHAGGRSTEGRPPTAIPALTVTAQIPRLERTKRRRWRRVARVVLALVLIDGRGMGHVDLSDPPHPPDPGDRRQLGRRRNRAAPGPRVRGEARRRPLRRRRAQRGGARGSPLGRDGPPRG